jgi:hypothetical protein
MASKKVARRAPTANTERIRGATKKNVDAPITQLLSMLDRTLEERFEGLFIRLIWRLGLVSQKDVGRLSQRIDQLERRLAARRPPARLKAVPRKPAAPSSSEGGSSSSSNSAA